MDKDNFLTNIKDLIKLGVKQDAIARESLVSEQTISVYVSGNSKSYTNKTMQRIMRAAKDIAARQGKQLLELAKN